MDSHKRSHRRDKCLVILGSGLIAASFMVVGCPPGAPGGGAEPIFPAEYRTTYTLTRDCRNSIEHAATIRVWVNDIGATAYMNQDAELPVGTIVVKEEFAGTECTDDTELITWSVMRKEAEGFDEEARDWRFQESAAPNRVVTINENSTCLECHLEPECVERDLMCTDP